MLNWLLLTFHVLLVNCNHNLSRNNTTYKIETIGNLRRLLPYNELPREFSDARLKVIYTKKIMFYHKIARHILSAGNLENQIQPCRY